MSEPKDCHKWQLPQMQMGGTQFIASEPVAAIALKCDPPERPSSQNCEQDCAQAMHSSDPSRAYAGEHAVYRAHAVKSDDSQTIRQTRVLNEPLSARPRARARGPRLLEQFKAWRIKTFGGDFDPVASAVDEAVRKISTRQPETDRALWLKIANRIGAEAFRDLMRFQLGRTSECQSGRKPKPLRNPSSAFQNLLNAYDEEIRNSAKGGVE